MQYTYLSLRHGGVGRGKSDGQDGYADHEQGNESAIRLMYALYFYKFVLIQIRQCS